MTSMYEELLQIAEDTVVGELMRPSLVHRLHTQLRAHLLRNGFLHAKVVIRRLANGFEVEVTLPKARRRVETIRFSINAL